MKKNKDKEPMAVVIHHLDVTTNKTQKINIEDKEICRKLETLLAEINIKDTISKTYLCCFWFICLLLCLGLYLYITKFEFIFSMIVFLGLFNIINLKRYNDWLELKEKSQDEFSDIVNDYLIKRGKLNERTKETL